MASPPPESPLSRAAAHAEAAGRSAGAVVSRHRLASGIIAGAAALGLLTVALLPSMAAADVTPVPAAAVHADDSEASVTPDAASGTDPAAPADASITVAKPAKPKKPKPASATRKARNVPEFPRDRKHHGKRVVYDKALMTVWLINKRDEVVARYPVVGRFDRPAKGVYRIYSKSPQSSNPFSKVTFNHMVRFAWGPDTKASIGLHAIPRYYDGKPMHSIKELGLAIARGGCVRLSEKAAAHVYRFADVGDRVVVLPSP